MCRLENFASYDELDFDFTNQGLTLIRGLTGAGKSTLCDAIPWLLFGITSKGGSVSDVLSWPGNKIISGVCQLEGLHVYRSRGPKPKDNDLCFCEESDIDTLIRGKDIIDTQRLLNSRLGIDADIYLSGAYFHEFSQTANFFITTAKIRRMICEQIVDLSLANRLQIKAKELDKENEEELDRIYKFNEEVETKAKLFKRLQKDESTKAEQWEDKRISTMQYLTKLGEKFEANRVKLIKKECPSCGTVLAKPKTICDDSENPHFIRLKEIKSEINPYHGTVKDYTKEIEEAEMKFQENTQKIKGLKLKRYDLEMMTEILQTFRSTLIQNNIKQLEDLTNKMVTDYFDAEIQVTLECQDKDKLEALIQKDGNSCSYTQLSKGQRQLLKLCFAVAVMQAVGDHKGVKFNQIFFDEALSGLDDSMKAKAFKMLESLQEKYESIFLIDHSEGLKTLFLNVYSVSLVNGHSQICQA